MMYIGGVEDEAGNHVAAAVLSYGGLESSPFLPAPLPTPLAPGLSLSGGETFSAAGYIDDHRTDEEATTSHHLYDQFGSASSSTAAAAQAPVYFNDGRQDLNSIVAAEFRPFFANSVPEMGGFSGSHQAEMMNPGGGGYRQVNALTSSCRGGPT